MGAFQLLAGADEAVLRLFHLRVGCAAAVQRQADRNAHLVLAYIRVFEGVWTQGVVSGGTVVTGIGEPGRRIQVDRWHIAGLRRADLLTCQVLAQTGGQQAQVARFRFFQQVVHRFRALGIEAIGIQRGQLRIEGAGDLAQRFQRVVQVVAGSDFGRQHGIVGGTGVLHVGDRHQAYVEALGGLI